MRWPPGWFPASTWRGRRATAEGRGADKLGRIAVTTWSLHAFFPQTKEAGLGVKGEALELRRFPELVADRLPRSQPGAVQRALRFHRRLVPARVKESLTKAHARVVNMPVDYPHDWDGKGLCDPDDKQWRWEIAERKKWIDVAAELDRRRSGRIPAAPRR